MKNLKNKGFTLAEVLITLALIGVVASLTMPALMTNIQKSHVGPALAKAINTLETANGKFKAEKNVTDIEKASVNGVKCSGVGNYLRCLVDDGHLSAAKIDSDLIPVYYKYNSNEKYTIPDTWLVYQSKDGILFYTETGGGTES